MNPGHWIEKLQLTALPVAIAFGSRLLGAIALWIVGHLIIRLIRRITQRAFESRRLDPMLSKYLDSVLSIGLKVILIVTILSVFGVETATFAGLLAAAGIAIGMAWSGLLSNFAAGVFLVFLRPLKVGDFITAAGVTGTVQEVGLFVTCIDTLNNVRIFVGNSKILGDNIENWSALPYLRIELTAQLAHGVNPDEAMSRLRERLAKIPQIAKDPAPTLGVQNLTLAGPVLAVRIFATIDDYFDAGFEANRAIVDEFAKAGYPIPETHHFQRQLQVPSNNRA